MDDATRAVARNMFRLRVFESDGQAYQDLFVRVMQYANSEFRAVRPYGRIGDYGNDGYLMEEGVFYQVYAPEEVRRKPYAAVNKLRRDFRILKRFWTRFSKLREYYFVINDKYRGVPPTLEKALEALRNRHRLRRCSAFCAAQLEEVLFSLKPDVIISIIGHVPVIDYDEFMLLTGLTYFLAAWIEFEKAARAKVERLVESIRGFSTRLLIEELRRAGIFSPDSTEFLCRLNRLRNRLVHGDGDDAPRREEIDRLVEITSLLKAEKRGF